MFPILTLSLHLGKEAVSLSKRPNLQSWLGPYNESTCCVPLRVMMRRTFACRSFAITKKLVPNKMSDMLQSSLVDSSVQPLSNNLTATTIVTNSQYNLRTQTDLHQTNLLTKTFHAHDQNPKTQAEEPTQQAWSQLAESQCIINKHEMENALTGVEGAVVNEAAFTGCRPRVAAYALPVEKIKLLVEEYKRTHKPLTIENFFAGTSLPDTATPGVDNTVYTTSVTAQHTVPRAGSAVTDSTLTDNATL